MPARIFTGSPPQASVNPHQRCSGAGFFWARLDGRLILRGTLGDSLGVPGILLEPYGARLEGAALAPIMIVPGVTDY